MRILCPIHQMPDCSPLLNGCSMVNQIHSLAEDWEPEEVAKLLELLDRVPGATGSPTRAASPSQWR